MALICVALCAACAKMPSRGDYIADTPPKLVADENYAVVYFLRDSAFFGTGTTYYVHEDNRKIGMLKSGSYFIHKTEPGEHIFWAETESRNDLKMDLQAGHTYYVEGGIDVGVLAGRPKLTEINRQMAEQILPDLKYLRLATPEETEAYHKRENGIEQAGVAL